MKRIISEYHSPTKKVSKFFKKLLFYIYKNNNARCILEKENKDNILFLFIDLDIAPLAYDVAGYLAFADLERQKLNLEFVHIIVVPGRENGFRLEVPEYDQIVNLDERKFRLWNILIPMFNLLPSLNGFTVCINRDEAKSIHSKLKNNFFPKNWKEEIPTYPMRIDFFKKGFDEKFDILSLRAPIQATAYIYNYLQAFIENRKLIVITIRDYGYTPAKNSKIENWFKFADSLDKAVYEVLFVPDTDNALLSSNQYSGRRVLAEAAFNIQLRMAIYEAAYLNLAVNQGPMELCWYNKKCNYLMFFKPGKSPITSISHLMREGIMEHETPRFSTNFQKWVWEDDEFDDIVNEFNLMIIQLEQSNGNK
jgi:hypothetical protein